MDYEQKYIKYKAKYLALKSKILLQSDSFNINEQSDQTLQNNDKMVGGSIHRLNFFRKYNLKDKGYSLKELSRISKVPLSILQEVYNRGIGAYRLKERLFV